MCECGLFPAYSQQLRSPTSDSPIKTLPGPFNKLCLDCIAKVYDEYNSRRFPRAEFRSSISTFKQALSCTSSTDGDLTLPTRPSPLSTPCPS